jgi:hypothetical protein
LASSSSPWLKRVAPATAVLFSGGLTQSVIARHVGIGQATVSAVLHGHASKYREAVLGAVEALGSHELARSVEAAIPEVRR